MYILLMCFLFISKIMNKNSKFNVYKFNVFSQNIKMITSSIELGQLELKKLLIL
jgi:hypothetical protein